MTKFKEVQIKASVLESICDGFNWSVESTKDSIKSYREIQEENPEYDYSETIEEYEYRLKVYDEVKKMLEKMI